MIITRTPFRVSFFGGGTDYPAWYRRNGGVVLATTIDKYCYITCRYLPPFFEHKYRIVYSRIENVQKISEIQHPAVKAVLDTYGCTDGLEVHHDGDLPARAGLGSSSSFTVGLINAVMALQGKYISKEELASQAIHVEQDVIRENVGSQDQVLAAYGGLNHVTFLANGGISVRPITIPPERLEELNAHLMLFYTGIQRTASQIAATYVTEIDVRRRQLRVIKDLVEEAIEILRCAPEKVDLVIVDRIMAGMDGIETVARLRVLRPSLRAVLCSGSSDAERMPSGAVPDGFDDFLQKPYERETLARKVRSVLDA